MAAFATASLALLAIMTVLTIVAIQGQREAERQRAEADGLIEFMLTDLRTTLEPVGRLDALDAVGQRAMAYYGGQKPGRLDPDALGRRARASMLATDPENRKWQAEIGYADIGPGEQQCHHVAWPRGSSAGRS